MPRGGRLLPDARSVAASARRYTVCGASGGSIGTSPVRIGLRARSAAAGRRAAGTGPVGRAIGGSGTIDVGARRAMGFSGARTARGVGSCLRRYPNGVSDNPSRSSAIESKTVDRAGLAQLVGTKAARAHATVGDA